ncbi:MAG: DUF1570 domain-containing protein [Planctomyces sp.]|nr:DUF1570 domain-containing protein [Planctomyces sp.]
MRTLGRFATAALSLAVCLQALAVPALCAAEPLDHIRIVYNGPNEASASVAGQVLVRDQQGGVLLEDAVGVLWSLTADRIVEQTPVAQEFQRLDARQLADALRAEFGAGFQIVTTPHYVIAAQTSRPFAEWTGDLFERLHAAFLKYWSDAGLAPAAGDAPLAVIIFSNRARFIDYARQDAAAVISEAAGYYSARTNRVVLFDLTTEAGSGGGQGGSSRLQITRRLAGATALIATVVHEAVHQLAFNSGLQTRYADNPMWLSEGLAMHCETPDLGPRGGRGWTGIGAVSAYRLRQFRDPARQRRATSKTWLTSLVQSEDRFRDPDEALAAYAESWVLTHFLIERRREAYVEYLRAIGQKPRLAFDSPEERLAEFRAAFGDDLDSLQTEVERHAMRLRPDR